MTGLVYANFAKSTLAGAITNTSLTIALSAGSGALFPPITGNQYFIGVLTDAATQLQHEVVKVTAISGDTVTVVRGQEGTTAQNWNSGDYFANLVTKGGLATFNQNLYTTYDLSSPPSSDLSLNAGDQVTITFESVTSVPLRVASVQGFYTIQLVVMGNNSTNSDMFLFPNNTSYTNAFSRYAIIATDVEITSFGSATSDPGVVAITGGVPGYSALYPQNAVAYLTLNTFFIDMFSGPQAPDTINDRGGFVADMLISTFTAAKVIKSTGAIIGGAHVASSIWSDTVTAWTSLGTIQVSASGGGSGGSMATISGVAVIRRLA